MSENIEFADLGFLGSLSSADYDTVEDSDGQEQEAQGQETTVEDGAEADEQQQEAEAADAPETFTNDEGDDEGPESVGGEGDSRDSGAPTGDTSPNNFSSIALDLKEVGALRTLGEDRLRKVASAADFVQLIKDEVANQLDESERRVHDALANGMPVSDVQRMQQAQAYYDQFSDDDIEEEGDKAEQTRKNLIYQGYLLRNFSEDEARQMVERSLDSGHDKEDARKALAFCKKFYKRQYDDALQSAKQQKEEQERRQRQAVADMRGAIESDDDDINKALGIDRPTRRRILNALLKADVPAGKDGSGHDVMKSAVEKWVQDSPQQAYRLLSTIYVLTEGGAKPANLAKAQVRKETRKAMDSLASHINSTSRTSTGGIRLVSGVSKDEITFNPETFKPL